MIWDSEMQNYIPKEEQTGWKTKREILIEKMKIKELRESVNMTQSQFAEWLSTSIENIKNWERGKSQPSEMLLKLISYYVEGHKKGTQLNIEEEKTFYVHELQNSYGQKWCKHVYEKEDYDLLLKEHAYYCGEGRFKNSYKDKIYRCTIIEEIEL